MADGEVRIEIKPDGTQQFIIDVGKAAEDAGEAANKASKGKSGFFKEIWTGVARSIGQAFTQMVGKAIDAIGDFVKKGVEFNAEIEKYEVAFTGFLGSAEAAQEAISNIREDAAKTPFDVASLVQANQLLVSSGESAEDARETILALGDAISATGGGNDEFTRMAANLQQVRNVGKASAIDIKQFAMAGINIYAILADYLGTTTEQVKDMEVSYDVLNAALKKAASEGGKYYGAMQAQAKTFNGQLNIMKANVSSLSGTLTKDLFEKLSQDAMPKVNEWISELMEAAESGGIDGALDVAGSVLGELFAYIGSKLPEATSVAVDIVMGMLDAILDNLPAFAQAGFDLVVELISGLADNLPELIPEITGVIVDIIDILTDPENLQKLLDAGWDLCVAVIEGLISASLDLSDRIPEIIDNIVTFLLDALSLEKLDAAGYQLLDAVMNGFVGDGSQIDNAAATIIKRLAKALWNSIFPLRTVSASIGDSIADWIMGGSGSTTKARGGSFSFSSTSTSGSGGGRHASGLTYVPYDGYMAQLHVGERVLTANEARDYATERYVTQRLMTSGGLGAREIIVPLYIDGHEFARATAWDMGESLAWEEM